MLCPVVGFCHEIERNAYPKEEKNKKKQCYREERWKEEEENKPYKVLWSGLMFNDIKSIFSLKAPRLCFCRCALRLFFSHFSTGASEPRASFISLSLSLSWIFLRVVCNPGTHAKHTLTPNERYKRKEGGGRSMRVAHCNDGLQTTEKIWSKIPGHDFWVRWRVET